MQLTTEGTEEICIENLKFEIYNLHFPILRFMAGWTGIEPATSDVTGRRSNQLNYHPTNGNEQLSVNNY